MVEKHANHSANWQDYSKQIYNLRNSRNKWITREVSTFDFSSTAASGIEKTTLDVNCELVREKWSCDDKYVLLPVALRRKGYMFEFDAKLPNNASVSLVENKFRSYYLEYEFCQMCEDEFGINKEDIPSYTLDKVRKLIIRGTFGQKSHSGELGAKKSRNSDRITFYDKELWGKIEKNDKVKRFLKLIDSNSIIILKIPRDADFSILKIVDLKTGQDGFRKSWHFNIFNPIVQFSLDGKIADATKVIMPDDIRLSRAVIAYIKGGGTARVSKLDISGDGIWGVGEFKRGNSSDFLGLFAISPKRSQMITTGIILITLALAICFGCIWKSVKIDIFDNSKSSTIWTMAIPVMVFIFTQFAVKNPSSSYLHNLLTRKYRISLTTSFVLLTFVLCLDDSSWNPSFFRAFNSFYPIKWLVGHNIHPGWLTIGLTLAISYIWTGFLVSYYRARPKNFRNRSYST